MNMERRTVFLVGGAIATTLVILRSACGRQRFTSSMPECIAPDTWNAEAWLDEAIAGTFPASDPISCTVETGVLIRPLPAPYVVARAEGRL
jgi:hypothetical protein